MGSERREEPSATDTVHAGDKTGLHVKLVIIAQSVGRIAASGQGEASPLGGRHCLPPPSQWLPNPRPDSLWREVCAETTLCVGSDDGECAQRRHPVLTVMT